MRHRRIVGPVGLTRVGVILTSAPAAAQGLVNTVDQGLRDPAARRIEQAAVAHLIATVVLLTFWVLVVLAAAAIVWGVYAVMQAAGDEDRVAAAKKRVWLGAIGLSLVLLAGIIGWVAVSR